MIIVVLLLYIDETKIKIINLYLYTHLSINLPMQLNNEIGRYLPGVSLSLFSNKGNTFANFQDAGNLPSFKDLLNNIHRGIDIVNRTFLRTLWEIWSWPTELLTSRFPLMSSTSALVITILASNESLFQSKCGKTVWESSIFEIETK